jgi:hypothetical protein
MFFLLSTKEPDLLSKNINILRSLADRYKLHASRVRVREKITSQFIALRFSSDLDYLNELNRKRNLSYTEDSVSEDRTKMVWK